jgi:hypothetical protein
LLLAGFGKAIKCHHEAEWFSPYADRDGAAAEGKCELLLINVNFN